MPTPDQIRRVSYMGRLYGLKIPVLPVCRGHQSPGYLLAQLIYDRPPLSLCHGPRGSGKSLLSGLASYQLGQAFPEFEAKILGGSEAQSRQIYRAMELFRKARPEANAIKEMLKTEAYFHSGARVEMLTASDKSVRGPHVPQLYLDEVDEMESEIRESSFGMAMRKGEMESSISMTSTWHKVAGPMAELMRQAREESRFPVITFCMFEVLERCPDERSGPALENCPTCPLFQWCHADREDDPLRRPKAKRSCGHYSIESLIQKTLLSNRVFSSDYLSLEPRAESAWFTEFSDAQHVSESAEYRPGAQFHVSIDPGVHTGAVWFQSRISRDRTQADVNVFGDYYAEGVGAYDNARAIVERTSELTGSSIRDATVSMDPAGRQKTSVGPTVVGEYKRADCLGRFLTINEWPWIGQGRPKADTLAIIESLLKSASGVVSLRIHPRCKHLIAALKSYERARSPDGQSLDYPKDPQHPAEEAIDALAGGLTLEMPDGRAPAPDFRSVPANRVI